MNNDPAQTLAESVNGQPANLSHATPPAIADSITAQEHAAVRQELENSVRGKTSLNAAIMGLLAGGVLGGIWGAVSKHMLVTKTFGLAAAGGVTAFLVNNLTWNKVTQEHQVPRIAPAENILPEATFESATTSDHVARVMQTQDLNISGRF